MVFTQPLIGNYGVPGTVKDKYNLLKHFESSNIQCAGIVVADAAMEYSHWTAVESLADWCKREGVAALTGVDTRAIVTYLREQGSSQARISMGQVPDSEEFVDLDEINLVKQVSTKKSYYIESEGNLHIAVLDCGVKQNILRCLADRGASVTVLPYDYPIHEIAHRFDGVFISNGPGDPLHCTETISNLRRTINTYSGPIFGICLGHQLLGLAVGAKTVKLKYGNRAHNIPTLDVSTGRCHITSQNHGYAVDASTLPAEYKEYFINLNDLSNEGMQHVSRPIFSTQFHPEAKGGPLDSSYLFDRFIADIEAYKESNDVETSDPTAASAVIS